MKEVNPQTVLVVDDQNDNVVLVSLWLQNLGYRVVTAANGESAVEVAKLAMPQLILMDIAMPVMDGLDATRRIRQTPEISDLPVVFLTAFDTKEFRQRAGDAGGDGYLTKPIDFQRLSKLILTLLPKEPLPPEPVGKTSNAPISDTSGNLDPRFMLWRMFCANNDVPIETLPSSLSRELKKKWQQLKKTPRPLFKF
ncbi:MAG TPA: response regulator [Pyrinomonadaceae bacterium]|jgi:CheY-like chemotaxis protein|nr:response regulator [Pyrinomonadaceae bacterium]